MLELISEHAVFGGVQRYYRHTSREIGLPMRFGIFLPPLSKVASVPVLFCLAGLTCTEETFAAKSGAQRRAAELGLILVTPDTSPRDAGVPQEADNWALGLGAGFYVDATKQPWSSNYRMYSYLLELRELILCSFPAATEKVGIMGHSMGGHGALVLALRNPTLFKSVSALAPICAPSRSPWGTNAFTEYFGERGPEWDAYDASTLMRSMKRPFPRGILIDQGLSDKFLADQLFPEVFEAACEEADQPLVLRRHADYDHGYYFIATVIDDHMQFHHDALYTSGVLK